jgi:hypothetical protein
MINRKTSISAILICALAAFQFIFADASESTGSSSGGKDRTNIRVSGTLETGIDIHNRVNLGETESRIIARGDVDVSFRPVGRVRADFGFEYRMRDTFVVVDKLYGQYNFSDDGAVRAGIMKKSFGLEERTGTAERYFHRRSIINSELDDLGFLGHDLTLQYRHSLDNAWRFAAGVAWSVEDSLRYLQNYSAQYNMDNMTFILAAVIRHYAPAEGVTTTFVSSLSARHTAALISEAEITFGTNPRVKAFEGREGFILGIRGQESFPVDINSKILRQIIPIAEAAFLWDDLQNGNFDTQLRAGVTLGFARNSAFQFRNNFGTVIRTRDGNSEVRRYRFDSEVVVVF